MACHCGAISGLAAFLSAPVVAVVRYKAPAVNKDDAATNDQCSHCSDVTIANVSKFTFSAFNIIVPWWQPSVFCGPPEQPCLFTLLEREPLGEGSTSEVFQWVCCRGVRLSEKHAAPHGSNGWFEAFAGIELGERVAVKCFAYSKDCIGSSSAGLQPPNYPTKFTTGVKERTIGAKLTLGEGSGKDHVNLLLASWLDKQGLWLIFKLVPDAQGLDEILAPTSPSRATLCAMPLSQTASFFKQFVMALQYLGQQGVVHRDGGLANWLISGIESSEPNVVLIDYGLSLCAKTQFTEPDSAKHILGHTCASGKSLCIDEALAVTGGRNLDMDRLNPIDWCYSPGAAGPKFPPPPELRVVRDELPSTVADVLKQQAFTLPYSLGYDVWALGWTFIQIVLGERWHDWKSGGADDPLVQHVQSCFFEKHYQVKVPWELGLHPPAWRLAVLASGSEGFRKAFLDDFLRHATDRITRQGLAAATPLQAAFAKPGSRLRTMLLKMIEFDASCREAYLHSGELLHDLEQLAKSEESEEDDEDEEDDDNLDDSSDVDAPIPRQYRSPMLKPQSPQALDVESI